MVSNIVNTRLDKLSEVRNAKLGFVFQGFNLISRTSAIENVELPMIYKGIPCKRTQRKSNGSIKNSRAYKQRVQYAKPAFRRTTAKE